jgi:aryl-alcohol dehydrogenase-like predicted oxidoreductase
MKYRKFGDSGIDVSVVGLGTWPLGNDFFGAAGESRGIETIHKALDLGINLVDTSPAYGRNFEAELTVGKALKGRRDKAVISTKFGVHRVLGPGEYKITGEYTRSLAPAVAAAELENSLKRLGTDYIDIYFIHWPDLNNGIDGALELLAKWKKEGKIRAGAVSNFSVEQIGRAIEKGGINGIQPPVSLLDRSSFENGVIEFAREKGLGIMTYGSLGGGILTGAFKEPPKVSDKELRVFFYDFFGEAKWAKIPHKTGAASTFKARIEPEDCSEFCVNVEAGEIPPGSRALPLSVGFTPEGIGTVKGWIVVELDGQEELTWELEGECTDE